MRAAPPCPDSLDALAPADELSCYRLPQIPPTSHRVLTLAFGVFMIFQALEAPLRLAFSLVGMSWLIYVRDLVVCAALALLAMQQMTRRQLQATFVILGMALLFHGIASYLQCGVPIAVLVSMKTLLNPMFGALFAPILLKRSRAMSGFMLLIWLVTASGIVADYAGVSMPWKGVTAEVGDYNVVVNKQWIYYGEDRIGGFARDSVGAGMLAAFGGIYVMLFARSVLYRLGIVAATAALIYLTTSKGGLIAFVLASVAWLAPMKKSLFVSKTILLLTFALMMLLPVALSSYALNPSSTVLSSFYDRIANVWPSAWQNIGQHSWIFGSGFGNIGAGQQFLHFEGSDPGDNLLLLAYGYFGVFSVIYLLVPFVAALRRRAPVDFVGRYIIITLIYVFAFGIVDNIIEGPIAAFMLGSALQALAWPRAESARELSAADLRGAAFNTAH